MLNTPSKPSKPTPPKNEPPNNPKVSIIAVPIFETWPGVEAKAASRIPHPVAPMTAATIKMMTASGSPQSSWKSKLLAVIKIATCTTPTSTIPKTFPPKT